MHLTTKDREKLKQVQMKLLKDFIVVCEKLGITYYAIGGTAIGAVREGGYIPWDDDIDVGLLRSDYEIFLREGQKHLKEGYFLQTFDTDGYPTNFAKIRDENTTFVETSVSHLKKVSHGIYIDVFPLDYFPAEDGAAYHAKKQKLAVDLACWVGYKGVPFKRKIRMLVGKLTLFFNPSKNSLAKLIKQREQLYVSCEKSDMLINNSGAWADKEVTPVSFFGEGILMPFEDIQIRVPKDYDGYLSHLYGDYMSPPPEKDRVPHHYVSDFSAEESYKTRKKR